MQSLFQNRDMRACLRARVRACTCVRARACVHVRACTCVRACVRTDGRTVCVQLTFQNVSHKKHVCVRACVRPCGRTVCLQLTFQKNGSHKKHGTEMQRLFCNIVRNTNLVHIIRTYTEHYHYAQTK